MLSAVQFFDVIVFFHVMAVILTFGPTYAYAVFLIAAEKRGGRAIPAVGDGIAMWDRIGSTAGLLVILASGLYLTADRWDFADFFISWGFLAIIVIGGIVHGYLRPRTRQLVELAERDIAATPGEGPVKFSSEFQALNAQVGKVGTVVGVVVLLTVYVMTAKPFL